MSPRIGSLCTSIGALDLAVEVATGGALVWYAESDPDRVGVLERLLPGLPNLGDITAADWSTASPVDVLTAGFPCQPASTAGLRLGRDDPRWIWPSVASAIEALQPQTVVLENVRGLLSLNNEGTPHHDDDRAAGLGRMDTTASVPFWSGFGDVLGDLADLGFNAEWDVFRSSDVGAPHGRARVFVVADRRRR